MKRIKKIFTRAGFTLVELLIVISILAILATFGIANFSRSLKRARDSRRKRNLNQIQKALEVYANDYDGQYPAANADGQIIGCDVVGSGDCVWGTGEFKSDSTAQATVYMKKVPRDPSSEKQYFYFMTLSGMGYKLYASLEDENDLDYYGTGYAGTDCETVLGVQNCTYGVVSSNESLP